ncbi:ribonuclease H-like protein [Ceraceosorus guamensis]|uniref:ribonuclease H n=1 Tax=Ceraceosorus guamensis TaxID=1522189 RepID=A0A316W8Q0_9BASI|nr:ribonuclease H-like protein [Ceraceosorus guamensis]PWN46212.1 ribonuclease H-like protein [Ceraceosorus guamensis]
MTNNRAELMAIIRACQLCPDPKAQLTIYTDSQYCIKVITQWQRKWRKDGWMTSGLVYRHGVLQPDSADPKPVVNKDLIRRLEKELRSREIRPELIYIKGHAGHFGNEAADK